MKRNDLRLRIGSTVALLLCLTVGALILPGTSVVVKAEEAETEQTEYTEQEIYVLPEIGATYPYGEYEFGYRVLYDNDNTIEIVSFSGGKSDEMDMNVDIPSVIEEKAVTSIGAVAFWNCVGISSVTIPEGVTSIGYGAFAGCSNLNNIIIPEGVTSIGSSAFSNCSNLNSIIIPKEVTSIESYTFYGCSDLNSIIIPEGVTNIGYNAFYDCSSLNSITIQEGLTSIDSQAFCKCSSLSSIIIPKGVTSIGSYAFAHCSSLNNIVIPEGVTSIEDGIFSDCSNLSSITIPEGVTNIGGYVFSDCINLNSITIPEGVTSIGRNAFYDCNSLKSIIIPVGVTSIEERTFMDCSSLSSIVIPNGITSIGDNAFFNCNSLSSITIPDGVTHIGAGAFLDCSGLSSIVISNGVTSIGGAAFRGCDNLRSIVIPEGVTSIGNNAFLECRNLMRITNNSKVSISLKAINYKKWYNLATGEEIMELGTGTAVSQYYVDDTAVRDFVNRLYTLVLAREADETGLESWTDALIKKKSNGVDIGYGFVFSDECKEKNLSNEDFVEILYNTFMNRASDAGGKASWVSQLDAGVEREKVFAGFIYSVEFADICSQYKIEVGNVFEVGRLADALAHYRNQNADITKFVTRCYTEALGREYEPDGLEAWCKVIIEKSNTPKQAAQSFIFSDEFLEKNLNNEEYVKVLYRTFMGREADEIGLAGWVEVLESGREDRMKVMEGFSDSVEFDGILQTFGLN